MTAALAASDEGSEVLVLERDERPCGSTGMSQGYVCAAGSRLQAAAGIEDSPELFIKDVMAKTRGQTDPDLVRTVAYESAPAVDWLAERHAIPFDINPGWAVFGHSRPRLHGMPGRTGIELVDSLGRAAADRGVLVSTGACATDVFADETGRVAGVAVERPDGRRETIGCGALVLATCGFGGNHAMVGRHIPHMADAPYFGHEGNRGDGISWGEALGGAVADMAAYQGYGALTDPYGIIMNYDVMLHGGFSVNMEGRRFSNELADVSGQAEHVIAQPGGEAWVVYDEARHREASGLPEYRDLLRLGAIRMAPTIEGLAGAMRVPAEALAQTLADVERLALADAADGFGRRFRSSEVLAPPFHAVKVKGALFHTQGGLVVDKHAQVRRPDGSCLPNLLAGGGAARSISGPGVWGYLPAVGLCMAVTLGRLAGRTAARLVGADGQAGLRLAS
jgi:fumarate reductase flavoprotein subunit